jgi:hypothetical protein
MFIRAGSQALGYSLKEPRVLEVRTGKPQLRGDQIEPDPDFVDRIVKDYRNGSFIVG